jgi:hypothetical protein
LRKTKKDAASILPCTHKYKWITLVIAKKRIKRWNFPI